MKKNLKILLLSAILLISFLVMYYFRNGMIREFLYELFFIQTEYDLADTHYLNIMPYWNRIYLFIFCMVVFGAVIFVLALRVCVGKQQAKLLQKLEMTLTDFRDDKNVSEQLKEYGSLSSLLYQIKEKEEWQIAMLEKQTRQKNDLISYLAHDMKTPLASVIGYLNLLHDVHDIPEKQRNAYVQITLDKANRLELLIDEFFDITRFNLHDIVISRGKIELRFFFEQLIEQFYPILIKKDKAIHFEMAEDIVYYGDADKLARAFNNILKNAVAYSYPHTTIQIDVKREHQQLRIQFHNQGDEIPKQQLERIFEKFYRMDQARSSNSGGAGLGLAIAKEIIHAHGGSIQAQSSRKETIFIVQLPYDNE